MNAAFVGLGVMGGPMAGHLASAGHHLRVFNRTPAKAIDWAKSHRGVVARSIAEAVEGQDMLVLCVGRDEDVRGVVTEALPLMAADAIVVDHTTTSAHLARDLADQARAAGKWFVDAPVSGGEAGAVSGQLSIMAGGEDSAVERATPVIQAYAKAIRHIGGPGAGQLTKMVNQICIAGVVQGLAEAVAFAKAAELDTDLVLGAISKGAAQSWQMDNRWESMSRGEFEFGFAVDWMRKDLALVLEEARHNGARVEVTALVDQFYAEVQALGGRRWDTSSLVSRLVRPRGT